MAIERSLRALGASVAIVTALATPSVAAGGIVSGEVRDDDGTPMGTMTYGASRGVKNQVLVMPYVEAGRRSGLLIRDRAERLSAVGDCQELGRHTAYCPWTEDDRPLRVLLGNRSDTARVKQACPGGAFYCRPLPDVEVVAGPGDDRLSGGGAFYGGRGDDTLLGAGFSDSWDHLHGGPGRDYMHGRGAHGLPDTFYDDESDHEAAPDVITAGDKARAEINYSHRQGDLHIDLHRRRIAPEGDRINGVKSVVGGSGNDVLIGTGGPNVLAGGPGEDRLDGRKGRDLLGGGSGDDDLLGGGGDDRLLESYWNTPGTGGEDHYQGGPGKDAVETLDHWRAETMSADTVACDSGDLPVQSDPRDTLQGCSAMRGWDAASPLEMRVHPAMTAGGATFALRCGLTEVEDRRDPDTGYTVFIRRCRGRLTLRSLEGAELGTEEFEAEFQTTDDFRGPAMNVTVELSDAARQELASGTMVEVEVQPLSSNGWNIATGGYRAVLG